tara:strand:- start:146 stop:265 length:120 start_codon:yes stop_codon:yes gene_type:complete
MSFLILFESEKIIEAANIVTGHNLSLQEVNGHYFIVTTK